MVTPPWHRGALNLPVNVPPDSGHILHGEAAGGTGVQSLLEHVCVARGVEEVGARWDVGSVSTAVDILTKRHNHHNRQSYGKTTFDDQLRSTGANQHIMTLTSQQTYTHQGTLHMVVHTSGV